MNLVTISAIIAAACSLAWVALVTPYWVAIPIYVVFEGAKAFFSKTYKTCLDQWLDHNEVPYENVEYWMPIELPEEE